MPDALPIRMECILKWSELTCEPRLLLREDVVACVEPPERSRHNTGQVAPQAATRGFVGAGASASFGFAFGFAGANTRMAMSIVASVAM
jgi:hypothetical protein